MSSQPLQILIIDGNPTRAAILEDGLREAGDVVVHHIREISEPLKRVAAIDPDVILIDLEDPSRDMLKQMFQVSRWARRPIAMFVDKSDSETVSEAIDAGVSAYIVDGLRKERVKPIVDVTIQRFRVFDRLQRELREARDALEERKVIDQAKRILMKQRGLDEEDAYVLLRRTAMNSNRRIADLARSLVGAADLFGDDDG